MPTPEHKKALRLARLSQRIGRDEAMLARHVLQAKVQAMLQESGIEGIDLNTPKGQEVLAKIQERALINDRVMPTVKGVSGDKFVDDVEVAANPAALTDLNAEYRAQIDKPADIEKVQEKEREKQIVQGTPQVHPLLEIHGLTSMQVQVLYVHTHPKECVDKFGDVSKESVAKYLGVSEGQIATCYDRSFMEALWRESQLALRMSKALVDTNLLNCALNPSPKYAPDRAMYYKLIGALENKQADQAVEKMSREKKILLIQKTLNKLTRKREDLKEEINGSIDNASD